MRLTGTTKPSCVLYTGSLACLVLGSEMGGWYWLFAVLFALAIFIDASRVGIHEAENNCG